MVYPVGRVSGCETLLDNDVELEPIGSVTTRRNRKLVALLTDHGQVRHAQVCDLGPAERVTHESRVRQMDDRPDGAKTCLDLHGSSIPTGPDDPPEDASYDCAVGVNVLTEIEIDRPRADVAAFACDPDNATAWYKNIKAVEWKTPKPLAAGSRIAFEARFLGRSLVYTYAVKELVPAERLVMSTVEGPFAMETTYTWQDTGPGRTRMTLRNRGEPSGFAGLVAPIMARAMRRANEKDLARLKQVIESQEAATSASWAARSRS